MKKQMKTNVFSAALGLGLIGLMLSSSSEGATNANQASALQGLPFSTPTAVAPSGIPFTVYLSLVTAFTNGQSVDFNLVEEEGQSSIMDKMTNWKEKQ